MGSTKYQYFFKSFAILEVQKPSMILIFEVLLRKVLLWLQIPKILNPALAGNALFPIFAVLFGAT